MALNPSPFVDGAEPVSCTEVVHRPRRVVDGRLGYVSVPAPDRRGFIVVSHLRSAVAQVPTSAYVLSVTLLERT